MSATVKVMGTGWTGQGSSDCNGRKGGKASQTPAAELRLWWAWLVMMTREDRRGGEGDLCARTCWLCESRRRLRSMTSGTMSLAMHDMWQAEGGEGRTCRQAGT